MRNRMYAWRGRGAESRIARRWDLAHAALPAFIPDGRNGAAGTAGGSRTASLRVNQARMQAPTGHEAAFAHMPALWAANRRIAAALFQDVAMIVLRVWSRECSMHASDWGVRR